MTSSSRETSSRPNEEPYRILAIVEGHGEVRAVPALLHRAFRHRRFQNFETPVQAIRAPGSGALKCAHDAAEDLGIESFVELAVAERPDGILIVLDADDECMERGASSRRGLGQELCDRARAVAPHVPIEVAVADREYEAWFLERSPGGNLRCTKHELRGAIVNRQYAVTEC
jgi:hypothetical protein